MKTRRWLLLLLVMIVATMSMATYTGVTTSLFSDGEASTNDFLGIHWGLTTLNDGFEDTGSPPWDDLWDGSGTTAWVQDSANPRADFYSGLSDKNNKGLLTSDDFDASATTAITVSFWFRGIGLDAGDLLVEIYNGVSYATLADVATLPSYVADDTWYQFAQVISDSQYFVPGFHLRFNSTVAGTETGSVDDVRITTIVDVVDPAAPTGLGATPSDSQVSLNWTANTDPDLYGYNVYRGTADGGPYSKINGSLLAANSYLDTGPTNGTPYYYVVTAVDTSTNESVYSGQVNATPADAVAPAAPTGLGATPGDSQVGLNWNDNGEGDLAGYNVYRSLTSGSGYAKINGSLAATSDYSDNTASNGTEYFYVVRAVDTSTNESGNSNEASATPVSLPLLDDGFDFPTWDGNWDGNGTTPWTQDTTPARTGTYSATSDKSNPGLLTSDDLNTSGAASITVSFWYYSKGIDAGDILVKVSNDGIAWNTPWTLLTGGDLTTHSGFANNTWVFFSETIAAPYINVASFSLRFDSTGLADGGEAINIDDVLIVVN